MATNRTLDPESPNYLWVDQGAVVQSTRESDFNAIDPSFVIDRQGRHWLSLGSFWSGIKLAELDPATGKLLKPEAKPITIASRPVPKGAPASIEAPFIVARSDHYYLFVSYDYCCKGVNSTYYVVVGRAKKITGPYVGKDGSKLLEGGGTMFIRPSDEARRFQGQGHNGFLNDADGRDYVVFHGYDRQNEGKATLRIREVKWGADGWPTAASN